MEISSDSSTPLLRFLSVDEAMAVVVVGERKLSSAKAEFGLTVQPRPIIAERASLQGFRAKGPRKAGIYLR